MVLDALRVVRDPDLHRDIVSLGFVQDVRVESGVAIFTVELTNRSAWPLAVTTEGPLSDTMTITSTVNIPGRRPSLPPFAIVGFEGLFAIPPGGSLTVPIDLSLTDASVALREDPIAGAFMSAHAIINWTTTTMGLEPGALGVEVESDVVWPGRHCSSSTTPSGRSACISRFCPRTGTPGTGGR